MKETHAQAAEFLERQLELENPDLPPALRHQLANLGARLAEKNEKSAQNTTQSANQAEAKKETAEIIQLNYWEDDKHAAPNAVVRSALFPALATRQKENRRFLDEERIYSVAGLEVTFTGKQFDQSDFDVYLALLNLAQPLPLGTPVKFSAYSLLKDLGLSTGGENHKRLHSVLVRLRSGTVEIIDHKKRYFGGLIEGGFRDEVSLEYEITINPKFIVLFGFGMWTTIDKEQRHALGRDATAKSLHAYYSSHAAPTAHNYDTLAQIAGLTNTNKWQTKATLIKAHEHMKEVGFLESYEPSADKILPVIQHTAGQLRHIANKEAGKTKAVRRKKMTNAADILPDLQKPTDKK